MKYRTFIVFVIFLVNSCTTSQPSTTAAPNTTSSPHPTETTSFTSTPLSIPTATQTLAPLPEGREIIFEQSGDKIFRGTLYGEAETAILLANMSIGGDVQWRPLLAAIDPQRFTAVTFNYRSSNGAEEDTRLVFEALKENGYKRIICIGASLGVTACSRLTTEPEIIGIVLIAGRMVRGSLSEVAYPKLFIAGALDPGAPYTQSGYDQSAKPKELVLFPENRAHGTDLFASKDGNQFLMLLIDFVNELAAP